MCGLAYCHAFDGSPVNEWIFDKYLSQRNRGHDGFGLFNGTHLVKAAMEDRIVNWLSREKNKSSLLMFHHRWPTSTINTRKTAHPFTTGKYFGDTEYILVHNGVIRYPDVRHEEHVKRGIKYQSSLGDGKYNDSECLLWDFALWEEGKIPELETYGDVAFICMKVVKGKLSKLFFYHNWARPLFMEHDKKHLSLASTGLKEEVKEGMLYTWLYGNHHLSKEYLSIPTYKTYTYGKDDTWKGGSRPYSVGQIGFQPEKQVELLPSGKWSDEDPHYEQTPDHLRMSKKERRKLKKAIQKRYTELDRQSSVLSGEVVSSSVNTPTPAAVENAALKYLEESQGMFEEAYWRAERDYELLCESDDWMEEDIKYEKRMLELVMDYLENNPENMEKTSISSVYLAMMEEEKWLTA